MKTLTTVFLLLGFIALAADTVSADVKGAKSYFDAGNGEYNDGQYDQAIKSYTKAIAELPGFTDAYRNRGLAFYYKGRYADAISDFSNVLSSGDDLQVWTLRALCYLKTGQFQDAIADYSKVISLNPKLTDAYHNRGIAYANAGKYDEAIQDYNKALEMKPGDMKVYSSRGVAYVKKAMRDFKSACELGSRNACDDLKQLSK